MEAGNDPPIASPQATTPSSAASSHHPSAFSHAHDPRSSMSTAPSTSSHSHAHAPAAAPRNGLRPFSEEPVAGPSRPIVHARYSSLTSRPTQSPPPHGPPPLAPTPENPTRAAPSPVAGPSSGIPPISPRSTSLSNTDSPKAPRIPSRQLLQSALDLAQQAVEMDQGNDVEGALAAYREAVTRLQSVMERVSSDDGKRKKGGKSDEEGRTLRGIHDAYVARIQLLSSYEEETRLSGEAGIGELMLESPTEPAVNGIGLGHPLSPPRPEVVTPSTPSKSSIASTPRRLRMRASVGLEDEANLTAADGLVEDEDEKTLPPVPEVTHQRTSSLGRLGQLISSSTSHGTISQRRQKVPPNISVDLDTADAKMRRRNRSQSQPGARPESADDVPPLPNLRNKSSFSSRRNLAVPANDTGSMTSSLISPVPEVQPQDVAHRPFHLLRCLRSSMDSDGPGAYLTGSIHVPSAVWNTSAYSRSRLPGPRITAQDVKVRVIDQILLHLEILRHTGALLLDGPREVVFGVAGVAAPRVGTAKVVQVAEQFYAALEAFEDEMDGVYRSLVKGGVLVGGWKGKKANTMSWGSKMARSMDKMSGSKGLESPDKYVDILAALCSGVQTIDEHLGNFTGPCTPAYHAMSEQGFRAIETRVLRAAEFVRVVITPFVLDDFKQFFHRYLKAGVLYIEE